MHPFAKNRLRLASTWILAASLTLMLAGCGSSDDAASSAPAAATTSSSATSSGSLPPANSDAAAASEPTAPQESAHDNPLEVAGVTDYAAFKEQFLAFQRAVAQDDREQAATFALYPIRVNVGKVAVNVADTDAFVKQYDRILTEDVRKALAAQDVNTLFANSKGIMVGNGEIWFGVAPGTPEKYGIISVNVGDSKK